MKTNVLLAALLFALCGAVWAGEEARPENKGGRDGRGGPDRGGGRDAGAAGGRDMIRDAAAAFGGFGGGFGGGTAGPRGVMETVSRMLGMDIEDPKAPAKTDQLPLGAEKRFVLNVPVGGVDNPAATGNAWKVETIFKLTDEQNKSVEALRDEYAAEQKKLDKEILDAQKALAEKVKQLRLKYELRANDVLTGDDKGRKEKLDALSKETAAKNTEVAKETLPLYDLNDWQQRMTAVRTVREKTAKNNTEAEARLLELVPAESKEKIEEVLKQQAADRERANRWMNAGGRGQRPGEGGDGTVKPPRPPEADQKKDF